MKTIWFTLLGYLHLILMWNSLLSFRLFFMETSHLQFQTMSLVPLYLVSTSHSSCRTSTSRLSFFIFILKRSKTIITVMFFGDTANLLMVTWQMSKRDSSAFQIWLSLSWTRTLKTLCQHHQYHQSCLTHMIIQKKYMDGLWYTTWMSSLNKCCRYLRNSVTVNNKNIYIFFIYSCMDVCTYLFI